MPMITTTTRSSMRVKPRLSDIAPPELGPLAPGKWRAAPRPRPPRVALPSYPSPASRREKIPSPVVAAPPPPLTRLAGVAGVGGGVGEGDRVPIAAPPEGLVALR